MLKLPAMGESVTEATLTSWLKEVGDTIEPDESVVEVATDKVDSDVPCEVGGVLVEKRFQLNDVIQVGDVIGVIETNELPENSSELLADEQPDEIAPSDLPDDIISAVETPIFVPKLDEVTPQNEKEASERFFSPLDSDI